jgi:hypothetical protein
MINVCPSVHWWSLLSITFSWYRHTAENEVKSYSFASADTDITGINLHPESTHCTDKGSDKPGYSQTGEADEEEDMSWLLSQEPSL